MKLDLQVVSSVAIRRKKPSSRFSWLGKEKENIFILENRRVLVLYLPSGTAKSFSSKLNALVKDAIFTTDSKHGAYLVGILKDGRLFIWCKDLDTFEIIETPHILTNYFKSLDKSDFACRCVVIRTNEDASKIIVASRQFACIHIWSRNGFGPEDLNSPGCWTSVDSSLLQGSNASLDAVFPSIMDFGDTGFCTSLYSDSSHCHVATVHMQWPLLNNALQLPHTVKYHRITFALSALNLSQTENASQISFIARYSHTGDLLAVAINHKSLVRSSIMFVSPLSKAILVTDLKLERLPHVNLSNRRYWVNCLSWSVDDTFVVFITKLGAVGVVSRAGNLVSISSHGCNVENGPSRMIYFHPYVFVRNSEAIENLKAKPDDSAMSSTYDVLHQRFSVHCHPRMSVFLCSDGYMVTCVRLPQSTCFGLGLVAALVEESRVNAASLRQLMRLRAAYSNTAANTIGLNVSTFSNTLRERTANTVTTFDSNLWESSVADAGHSQQSFEDEESSVCDNPMATMECATLHFDSVNSVNSALTPHTQHSQSEHLDTRIDSLTQDLIEGLLSAWGAIATSSDEWCKEWQFLAVNNALLFVRIFKMILQYRDSVLNNNCVDFVLKLMKQILAVARFDTIWKHLTAITIDLVDGVTRCLVTQVYGVGGVLLAMLKHAELCLRNASQWLPCTISFEPSLYDPLCYMQVYSSRSFPEIGNCTTTVTKRMANIYMLVHKSMIKSYTNDPDWQKLKLICKVQKCMERLGVVWNVPKRKKINKGTVEWLQGNRRNAISFWEEQLDDSIHMKKIDTRMKRLMVTILYAHLWEYDIISAMQKICEWKKLSQLNTSYIKIVNGPLRCLGRFMASYFANIPLRIYPPYIAKELPSLITETPSGSRSCCLSRERVKCLLNNYVISRNFSLDAAMELLISGFALSEAVWLCYHVGDWKTAYLLSVLCVKSQKSAINSSNLIGSFCNLPLHLQPAAIMFENLQLCIGSNSPASNLSRQALHLAEDSVRSNWVEVLKDCFTASVLSNFSIASCLLQPLLFRLKMLVQSLEAKVGSDVYLPAPPVYCQQQASTERIIVAQDMEIPESETRMRISSLVHMIITVMKASNCVVPLCSWYLGKIMKGKIWNNEESCSLAGLSSAIDPLLKGIEKVKFNCNLLEDDGFLTLLWVFQDLVALLWLIHARDSLSRNFRKLQNVLDSPGNGLKTDSDPTVCCLAGLNWAQHLVPFAKCMDWGYDVDEIILSFVLESCESPLSAAFLAKRFPDVTKIPPELEIRTRIILQTWRKIVIRKHSTKGSDMKLSMDSNVVKAKKLTTLYLFHMEMCEEAKQLSENLYHQLNMRTDDDINFETSRPSPEKLLGDQSRAFEMDKDFHKFLGTFFEVALLKDEINHASCKEFRIPVELCFADVHRHHHFDKEMDSIICKATDTTLSNISDYSLHAKFNSSDHIVGLETGGLFHRRSFECVPQSSTPKELPTRSCKQTLASGSRWQLQKRKLVRSDPKRYPLKRKLFTTKWDSPNPCLTMLPQQLDATFSREAEEVCKLMHWLIQWSNRNHSILGSSSEPQMKIQVRLLPLARLAQSVFNAEMHVRNQDTTMSINEDVYGFGKRVLVEKRVEFEKIKSDCLTYTVESSMSSLTPTTLSSDSDDTLTSVTPLEYSFEEPTDQHTAGNNHINLSVDIVDAVKDDEKITTSLEAVEDEKSNHSESKAHDYNSYDGKNSKTFTRKNSKPISGRSTSDTKSFAKLNSEDDTLRDVDSPVSMSSGLLSIEKDSRNISPFTSRSHYEHLRVQRSHSDPKHGIPYLLKLHAEREDGSCQFDLPREKKISFRLPLHDTGNSNGIPRLLHIPGEIRPKPVARSQSNVEELRARAKLIPLESIHELQKRFLNMKPTQNLKLLRTELEEFEILERVSRLRQKRRAREVERRNTVKETVERASSPLVISDTGKSDAINEALKKDREHFQIPKHMVLPRSKSVPTSSATSTEKHTNLKHLNSESAIPSYAELNYRVVKKLQEAGDIVNSCKTLVQTTDSSTSPGKEHCLVSNQGTQCDYEMEADIGQVKVIRNDIVENGDGNEAVSARDIGVNTEPSVTISARDADHSYKEKEGTKDNTMIITLENGHSSRILTHKEVGVNTVSEMLMRTKLTDTRTGNVGDDVRLKRVVHTAAKSDASLPLLKDIMEVNLNSPWSPIRKSPVVDKHHIPKPFCLRKEQSTAINPHVKQCNVFEELAQANVPSFQESLLVPTPKRDKRLNLERDLEQRKITALSLMKDIVSSHQEVASKYSTQSKVNRMKYSPKSECDERGNGKKYTLSRGLHPVKDPFSIAPRNSGRNSVDSDDSDTLSPWIVPEEVLRILTAENSVAPS